MLFDTHAHINDRQFDPDRDEVIRRARENGVSYIVNVGYDLPTIADTIKLAETYDFIYGAVGWHPHEAKNWNERVKERIENLALNHPKVVAIGETGLDYYRNHSHPEVQQEVFRQQIRLAKRVNKPLIIHNREAHEDLLAILKEEKAEEVGGVMHCFNGDVLFARRCLELGFYLSFGGPVTFKNAQGLREVVPHVPLDRLLIETDCPYLAPHPFRGKRNEPGHVRYVAEKLAEILGMAVEELARITLENGKRLFRLV